MNNDKIDLIVDNLFREEYSKIVSFLTTKFGFEFIDTSEDIAQDTLMAAVTSWSKDGLPEKPKAWLYTVAKNKAVNVLKKDKRNLRTDSIKSFERLFENPDEVKIREQIEDSMLKMMFVCCTDSISRESQITLMLSTLCGFSRKEIAKALMSEEETIKKKLYRAKKRLRDEKIKLELPDVDKLKSKIKTVNSCLYLLFNEGYNSTTNDEIIRKDICLESLRLVKLLLEHFKNETSTRALFTLMCFHIARFESRVDNKGAIILFKEQNRASWNKELIKIGIVELGKSSQGTNLSTYHIEAGIAMEHCTAESFEKTNWSKIFNLYLALQKIKKSPVIDLNLGIIKGFINGPKEAISYLEPLSSNKLLNKYYLFHASLGEFYFRNNQKIKSRESIKKAISLTQNKKEKDLLMKKYKNTINV